MCSLVEESKFVEQCQILPSGIAFGCKERMCCRLRAGFIQRTIPVDQNTAFVRTLQSPTRLQQHAGANGFKVIMARDMLKQGHSRNVCQPVRQAETLGCWHWNSGNLGALLFLTSRSYPVGSGAAGLELCGCQPLGT